MSSAIGMSFIVPAIFGLGNAGSLAVAVAFLILFGLGWGCFDCNNMPILSQIVRPELRATGYGIMNFVSISCGGLTDWGFGVLRDRQRAAQRDLQRLRESRHLLGHFGAVDQASKSAYLSSHGE